MKCWTHAAVSLLYSAVHTSTLNMRIVIFITLLFVVRASTSKVAIQDISEKVATHIKSLTEKATSTIHKLAQNIDLKKLEKLDFLHLFTKKLAKKHHDQEVFVIDPYQVDRLKNYFEHTYGRKKLVGPHGSPHLQYGPPH